VSSASTPAKALYRETNTEKDSGESCFGGGDKGGEKRTIGSPTISKKLLNMYLESEILFV